MTAVVVKESPEIVSELVVVFVEGGLPPCKAIENTQGSEVPMPIQITREVRTTQSWTLWDKVVLPKGGWTSSVGIPCF